MNDSKKTEGKKAFEHKTIKHVLLHTGELNLTPEQQARFEAHVKEHLDPKTNAAGDFLVDAVKKLINDYNKEHDTHVTGITMHYDDTLGIGYGAVEGSDAFTKEDMERIVSPTH